MAEVDALSAAKFGGGQYLTDFPCKIRVLTRDPMVYVDKFANTRYAFAVYDIENEKVLILNKGAGFAKRFAEINADADFGADVRRVDLKITTNGKPGIEVRYSITPVGSPSDLPANIVKDIMAQGFDLAEVIKKNNPNALRLSAINNGAKVKEPDLEPSLEPSDTLDVGTGDPEEEIDLSSIPF